MRIFHPSKPLFISTVLTTNTKLGVTHSLQIHPGAFEWRRILLDAEEPSALQTLVRLCQKQLDRSQGQYQPANALAWHERWFCHLFDMPKSGSLS